MTLTGEGLVLGGTILVPLRHDRDGAPEIAIDGAEQRIVALLAVAYGKTARPGVLGNARRAARYWHRGENDLAAIEIALSGLPPLPDIEKASTRLLLGEQLLAEGLSPRELIELCGLDPASLEFPKAGHNPDQPRVPTGNPDGGQWTSEGGDPSPAAVGEGAGSSTPPKDQPSSAAGWKVEREHDASWLRNGLRERSQRTSDRHRRNLRSQKDDGCSSARHDTIEIGRNGNSG
ncbi:MAG: hypothetical protein WB710_12570 [Stellaceae bacterium]